MGIKDMMAADATAVFLDTTRGMAYAIVHRKAGDASDTETVAALIFWDEDQNQRSGPGSLNADRSGRRTLHSVLVELAGSIVVTPEKSKFLLGDMILTALKNTGRDLESGTQTWECNYSDGISTLKPRIRQG
jgi:hypothetical protein